MSNNDDLREALAKIKPGDEVTVALEFYRHTATVSGKAWEDRHGYLSIGGTFIRRSNGDAARFITAVLDHKPHAMNTRDETHVHCWERRQNVTSKGYVMAPIEVCAEPECGAARIVLDVQPAQRNDASGGSAMRLTEAEREALRKSRMTAYEDGEGGWLFRAATEGEQIAAVERIVATRAEQAEQALARVEMLADEMAGEAQAHREAAVRDADIERDWIAGRIEHTVTRLRAALRGSRGGAA